MMCDDCEFKKSAYKDWDKDFLNRINDKQIES